ncbi:rubrerythrin [Desulfonema ishimotonii]|uniref:Rubrerythrin n=1 Tax=Desulfonema ishimotonii TaxID=45657 RepID=A0A401FTU4_9BACT|nr:ferritin family protein [Desulfonema ishimotonii]GBC60368.1 rubrerythrin [Desulfonema ishimotonii]
MRFESLKDMIDFAIEKEQEAADFYTEASGQEAFSGSKEMLREFAREELKHKKMLEDMKSKGIDDSVNEYTFKWIPDIRRSDYVDDLTYAKGMGYRDMLMLAMKREEKALKLYNELLSMAEDDLARNFFKVLCQEEAKHKLALETMYDDYMAEMGD